MNKFHTPYNNTTLYQTILTNNKKVEFWKSSECIPYLSAINVMEQRVHDMHFHKASEVIWFLEHPSIITKGSMSKKEHLMNADHLPVFETSRGGQLTYHGPGQLIIYIMIDLSKREKDIRKFVYTIEQLGIEVLKEIGIKAQRNGVGIGLWVNEQKNKLSKIASIGIKIRKWISWHGMSININPNLKHFESIVSCGIKEHGVTSVEKMTGNSSNLIKHFIKLCPF